MDGWVVVIIIALVSVVAIATFRNYQKKNEQDERWRKEAEEQEAEENDKWLYNWRNQSASEHIASLNREYAESTGGYRLHVFNVEKIYKRFAKDYITKKFNREYRKIHTKQGDETEAYQYAINELCRLFRLTLFDDNDVIRDVYKEKFLELPYSEYKTVLKEELQNIIDGRPLYRENIPQTVMQAQPVTRERTVTHSQRQRILRRDNFTCQLCGARGPGARPVGGTAELRVDHKLPFSRGGTDDDSNLWTLCFECNSGKSDNYDDSGM